LRCFVEFETVADAQAALTEVQRTRSDIVVEFSVIRDDKFFTSHSEGDGLFTRESGEASRTLYVGNLPDDVSSREMSHIFRRFRGYEGCRIVIVRGTRHVCFVTFDTEDHASFALSATNGYPLNLRAPEESRIKVQFSSPKSK